MRDRLIELIDKYEFDSTFCNLCNKGDDECAKCGCGRLADYLLENGVIVPTFSCGDRVWFIPKGLGEVCEATVVRVEYNYFTSPQEWIVIDYFSSIVGKQEHKSRIDLMLGKTLFFTKEEAERALKGGEGKQ